MNKPIIILGNGGHAAVLVEILQTAKRHIVGYTAPEISQNFFGLSYLGDDTSVFDLPADEVELVLGIGTINASTRRKTIFESFKSRGYHFTEVIHPSAIISPSASIDEGTQIMAGVIVQTEAEIGRNTILNTGCQIDHHCSIGHHSHIAPGCILSGNVKIGEYCHVGAGTTVIQNITIGNGVLVGASSLVIKNISNHVTAFGVPAKER